VRYWKIVKKHTKDLNDLFLRLLIHRPIPTFQDDDAQDVHAGKSEEKKNSVLKYLF
jgi:hypothetical protein